MRYVLETAREAARTAVALGPYYYYDSHAAVAYVHPQDNDLDRDRPRAQYPLATGGAK